MTANEKGRNGCHRATPENHCSSTAKYATHLRASNIKIRPFLTHQTHQTHHIDQGAKNGNPQPETDAAMQPQRNAN